VSLSEHLLEPLEHSEHGWRRKTTEPPNEAFSIDGSELI